MSQNFCGKPYVRLGYDWERVGGRVHVTVQGPLPTLHAGDEVEVVGRLQRPPGPANPGEFDYAGYLRDQGIGSTLTSESTVVVLHANKRWSAAAVLGRIKGWGLEMLDQCVPLGQAGLASALLLAETTALPDSEWEKYLRTGVIHVLAISGQHMVVLAWFLWLVLRLGGVRQRRGIILIVAFLFAYALLTGGRPPVMRSAWMVLAWGGAILFRRPVLPANTFALSWLLVALFNPTDIFQAGCQLSFLAVAVLVWGVARFHQESDDPLQNLADEARPTWRRLVGALAGMIASAYLINFAVWLAVTPLIGAHYHLVSPVALLIGPPMVLLGSMALLFGFGVLLLAPVAWPLAQALGYPAAWCLAGAEGLVDLGVRLPGAYDYVPDWPAWWLWVFYAALLLALSFDLFRRQLLSCVAAGFVLTTIMVGYWAWPRTTEFRLTFLAVGHGGAVVIELPEGGTLLYDAGAITGPEATRRTIAPFLWYRGIRRIDELFVSHADLDHFNGVPALIDRFRIGRVTLTPSFAERPTPAVAFTLQALAQARIPRRVVSAGDHLHFGAVHFEVLHPPHKGPTGNENARSLVVHLEYAGLKVLLTGDLEKEGLEQVLRLPTLRVDVLQAPHHGSSTANTPALARWAHPQLVVSCQGFPRTVLTSNPYDAVDARYLATWPHGAITLRPVDSAWQASTFRSRMQLALK